MGWEDKARSATICAATVGLAYFSYVLLRRKKKATPKPLVVCGPSGVGKGTLLDMCMKDFPGHFGKCVSHTTRAPRAGEVNGTSYHFTSKEQIKKEIADGKFIEYAEVHGNIYGTSVSAVQDIANSGKVCILEIDVQGAQNVRETSLNPHYFFFYPPNFEALEKRLRGRNSETEDSIKLRVANAKKELDFMDSCEYADVKLVNDGLEVAYVELRNHLTKRYPQLLA